MTAKFRSTTDKLNSNISANRTIISSRAFQLLILISVCMTKIFGIHNDTRINAINQNRRGEKFLLGMSSQVFSFTGAAEAFTVPAGVDQITVELYGGSGGDAYSTEGLSYCFGGPGGMITATIAVTPGEILNIYAGEVGESAGISPFNGGGSGSTGDPANPGSSGGGGTDIRRSPYTLTDRLVVAGAGGGCYSYYSARGGEGGYPAGSHGSSGGGSVNPGGGGTANAGGNYGNWNPVGKVGTFGAGGDASVYRGGGGGGGYYGGGGATYAGGGGGSSFVNGTLLAYRNGMNVGNGYAVLYWSVGPSAAPTLAPTGPTMMPSFTPSRTPTQLPTAPSNAPTTMPSEPSALPTTKPTAPSAAPTTRPTAPTKIPTLRPSDPSNAPTRCPTAPSRTPTFKPTAPTRTPTEKPTALPSDEPTFQPTGEPTFMPTEPTAEPTYNPTETPTFSPTDAPTADPTQSPTTPTVEPSMQPTADPTVTPSEAPTLVQTDSPSAIPTPHPTDPTPGPTVGPTATPSRAPTGAPTAPPTRAPTFAPTKSPTFLPTAKPSSAPTFAPSRIPTNLPTARPTVDPTIAPSNPSAPPTPVPTAIPTFIVTASPTTPALVFDFTGAAQSFVVPAGVNQITVELYGASGGAAYTTHGSARSVQGGAGGMVRATISVTEGETLQVYIGAVGLNQAVPSFNGGGAAGTGDIDSSYGASGGGASDIRRSPYALANRLVVAGGGGGAFGYYNTQGGAGGYPSGVAGVSYVAPNLGGGGGQSGSGGAAGGGDGSTYGGTAGTLGQGGSVRNPTDLGAGGGGGHYGGGGSYGAGAGGGSGYATGATGIYSRTGMNAGDGYGILYWSVGPSTAPTRAPTGPTCKPTYAPSRLPTPNPSAEPTPAPSRPTVIPTPNPTAKPTFVPTAYPTNPTPEPSLKPTSQPTAKPTAKPTSSPTAIPTRSPTFIPTAKPSAEPTVMPTNPTAEPTVSPTRIPTAQPTRTPTTPTSEPTTMPSDPSMFPTANPSTPALVFDYTGAAEAFTVPEEVNQIIVELYGASGGDSYARTNGNVGMGGPGGMIKSTINVTPGEVLMVYVGALGTTGGVFSFNGGGRGGTYEVFGGSGGGATDIRRSPYSLADRLVIAGGGGGSDSRLASRGGSGGYTAGTAGATGSGNFVAGGGGTATAGGAAGTSSGASATAGTLGQGGSSLSNYGAGGGGGRYGGGGAPSAGGGGGSSYSSGTGITHRTGMNIGHGYGIVYYSVGPSTSPTRAPTGPTCRPTLVPSRLPTITPTIVPTAIPTIIPTADPSAAPTDPTAEPTITPTMQPTAMPTVKPTPNPSAIPTRMPTAPTTKPTASPTRWPTARPSATPTFRPTASYTLSPTLVPTAIPTTPFPSSQPSSVPTGTPTTQPTRAPTGPSAQPSSSPTNQPTLLPSSTPTQQPSSEPSVQPSSAPTSLPSTAPTTQPTLQPTTVPTTQPTSSPSGQPTSQPSEQPSARPSVQPSIVPSAQPSDAPSTQPTTQPMASPTVQPTSTPSVQPSQEPSSQPSSLPSMQPSAEPTSLPSVQPSSHPTGVPTSQPSQQPTGGPSGQPSQQPIMHPTAEPTVSQRPTPRPSVRPSEQPTSVPSSQPSHQPSAQPAAMPTSQPSVQPTGYPSGQPSHRPTVQPTALPTGQPTTVPTSQPSVQPSARPTGLPSRQPSQQPSAHPSGQPAAAPSAQPSEQPSSQPTAVPTLVPSAQPSSQPTGQPSGQPTRLPSAQPSGQPAAAPSAQPSEQPSSQPTAVPTLVPSAQPSSQPTGQPSGQPTRFPSAQPSGQPAAAPSAQPSEQPSSLPTALPSRQPSTQPSCRPSGQSSQQPTEQPTAVPTGQPSVQPSRTPSGQPSGQPVSFPSSQPSVQPSRQPFAQPSARPTAQPFARPSGVPTSQPSGQPSLQPACAPSAQPSCQPSAQPSSAPTSPTAQPSRQPSRQPTSQPSRQPSTQPTGQPTSQPTSSRPTGVPSGAPTKRRASPAPTPRGATNRPTVRPTAVPSLSMDYLQQPTYFKHLADAKLSAAVNNSFTFATYYFNGLTVGKTCDGWNQYYTSEVNLPFADVRLSRVTLLFSVENFDTRVRTDVTAVCENPSVAAGIAASLLARSTYEANCNGFTWLVFPCNGNSVLCVNCKRVCVPSVVCPGSSMVVNPCSACRTHAGASAVVNFQYQKVKLYPNILLPMSVMPNKTSAVVALSTSRAVGTVYCAALPSETIPTSVLDIRRVGSRFVTSSQLQNITLPVGSLSPDTDYTAYCYTEDFIGYVMPLEEALRTAVQFRTLCCKSIQFPLAPSVIAQYVPDQRPELPFTVRLDARPLQDITVSLTVDSARCSPTETAVSAFEVVPVPSTLSFRAGSTSSLTAEVVVRGSTLGCYTLTARQLSGSVRYLSATTAFRLTGYQSPPSPPRLVNASISSDGTSLVFLFDSPTDRGASVLGNFASTFSCVGVALFTGSAASSCKWISFTRLEAVLTAVTNVSAADTVRVLAGVVKAACVSSTNCTAYPAMPESTTTVISPLTSVSPQVFLLGPATVAHCENITLDATSSTGFAGRSWKAVTWKVETTGIATGAASIESWLQSRYPSTSQLVTVPRALLTPSTQYATASYKFTLVLTNFLGQTAAGSTTVIVSRETTAAGPTLSLLGADTLTYRWKPLRLFASVGFSTCSVSSTAPLYYTWAVYAGLELVPAIQSTSLNQRYLALSPYTLEASTDYRIVGSVSTDSTGRSAALATATWMLQVGSLGIQAVISGGASRSLSVSDPILLDASDSRDLDYPEAASLTYRWSCTVLSPDFGSTCNGFAASTSAVYSLSAGSLAGQSTYQLRVTVIGPKDRQSVATVEVKILSNPAPSLLIDAVPLKVNPDSKIIITGRIDATRAAVDARWTSTTIPDLTVPNMALTNTAVTFPAGFAVFPLALRGGALIPRVAYTFQLTSSYVGSNVAPAVASITILTNSPPTGGGLTVTPSAGTALETLYTLTASYWSDDAEDLPLMYLLSYYLFDPNKLNTVKSADTVPYATTQLGQGLSSNSFRVYCTVRVTDVYQSAANATATTTVGRAQGSTLPTVTSQLDSAFANADPRLLASTMSMALSVINSVDCAVSVACGSINREICQGTPRTCGACLAGTVGPAGDSNAPCYAPAQLRKVGESCTTGANCITGSCGGGVCTDLLKTCPNSCNDQGTCAFNRQSDGAVVATCSALDPSCTAACECFPGFFGKSCDLTADAYQDQVEYRELLCFSTYKSLRLDDANEDTVKLRLQTVGSILSQIEQISDAALRNCTAVLVEIIEQSPELSCSGEALILATDALSNILAKGRRLSAQILSQVTVTLAQISSGCQVTSAVGELPSEVENANVRFTSAVIRRVSQEPLILPQSAYERFNDLPQASVTLDRGSGRGEEVAGVSLIMLKNNPHGVNTSAGQLGLMVSDTFDSGSGRRLSSAGFAGGYTLVLQNTAGIFYVNTPPETLTFHCNRTFQQDPYVLTANCSNGTPLTITCPSMTKRAYNISCASAVAKPQCSVFNGNEYTVNPDCTAVSFSATNTTCYCTGGSGGSNRQLSEGALMEVSTVVAVVATDFAETFADAPSMTDVTQNLVIFSTLMGFIAVFVVGMLGFAWWDKKDQLTVHSKQDEKKKKMRTINMFFDALFPDELRGGKWYYRVWNRMLLEHPWLQLCAPYEESGDTRTVKWTLAMGNLLVFLFMNSIVALMMYADDGVCESIADRASCEETATSGGYFKVCEWRTDNDSCRYQAPEVDFLTSVYLTLIVAVVSTPFDKLWEYLVVNVSQFLRHYNAAHRTTAPQKSVKLKKKYDEFSDVQSWRSNVMRAARLRKAQTTMDAVSPLEETLLIQRNLAADRSRWEEHRLDSLDGAAHYRPLTSTRYGGGLTSHMAIKYKVIAARQQADQINQALHDLENSQEREEQLMKYFIVHLFTGYKRPILSKYFLGDRDVLLRTDFIVYQQYASIVLLPTYAALMIYFIFVLNVSIGSRSTNIWLLVCLLSFLQDTFLLDPLKIWIQWMLINKGVSEEARAMCEELSRKSRLILKRSFGQMRHCYSMVQHFNPACRAARMCPRLPVARLLLSINDEDLRSQATEHWSSMPYLYITTALLSISLLPELLQDTALDIGTSSVIDFSLVLLYLVSHYSVGLFYAIMLVTALWILYVFDIFPYVAERWNQWQSVRKLKEGDSKEPQATTDEVVDFDRKDVSGKSPSGANPNESRRSSRRTALFDPNSIKGLSLSRKSVKVSPFTAETKSVRLNSGKEAVVSARLTKFEPLREITSMNRKFNIEQLPDVDLLHQIVDSDSSDSSEEDAAKAEEKAPEKSIAQGFSQRAPFATSRSPPAWAAGAPSGPSPIQTLPTQAKLPAIRAVPTAQAKAVGSSRGISPGQGEGRPMASTSNNRGQQLHSPVTNLAGQGAWLQSASPAKLGSGGNRYLPPTLEEKNDYDMDGASVHSYNTANSSVYRLQHGSAGSGYFEPVQVRATQKNQPVDAADRDAKSRNIEELFSSVGDGYIGERPVAPDKKGPYDARLHDYDDGGSIQSVHTFASVRSGRSRSRGPDRTHIERAVSGNSISLIGPTPASSLRELRRDPYDSRGEQEIITRTRANRTHEGSLSRSVALTNTEYSSRERPYTTTSADTRSYRAVQESVVEDRDQRGRSQRSYSSQNYGGRSIARDGHSVRENDRPRTVDDRSAARGYRDTEYREADRRSRYGREDRSVHTRRSAKDDRSQRSRKNRYDSPREQEYTRRSREQSSRRDSHRDRRESPPPSRSAPSNRRHGTGRYEMDDDAASMVSNITEGTYRSRAASPVNIPQYDAETMPNRHPRGGTHETVQQLPVSALFQREGARQSQRRYQNDDRGSDEDLQSLRSLATAGELKRGVYAVSPQHVHSNRTGTFADIGSTNGDGRVRQEQHRSAEKTQKRESLAEWPLLYQPQMSHESQQPVTTFATAGHVAAVENDRMRGSRKAPDRGARVASGPGAVSALLFARSLSELVREEGPHSRGAKAQSDEIHVARGEGYSTALLAPASGKQLHASGRLPNGKSPQREKEAQLLLRDLRGPGGPVQGEDKQFHALHSI